MQDYRVIVMPYALIAGVKHLITHKRVVVLVSHNTAREAADKAIIYLQSIGHANVGHVIRVTYYLGGRTPKKNFHDIRSK